MAVQAFDPLIPSLQSSFVFPPPLPSDLPATVPHPFPNLDPTSPLSSSDRPPPAPKPANPVLRPDPLGASAPDPVLRPVPPPSVGVQASTSSEIPVAPVPQSSSDQPAPASKPTSSVLRPGPVEDSVRDPVILPAPATVSPPCSGLSDHPAPASKPASTVLRHGPAGASVPEPDLIPAPLSDPPPLQSAPSVPVGTSAPAADAPIIHHQASSHLYPPPPLRPSIAANPRVPFSHPSPPSYAQVARSSRGPGFVRAHASAVESFARIPRTGVNVICGSRDGLPSFSFAHADLAKVEELYSKALVMKFFGGRPSLEASHQEILSWGIVAPFSIGPLTSRAFLLRFQDDIDLLKVLSRPSSSLIRFPYKIFRWHGQCHLQADSCMFPVWISLPRLPLQCFAPEFLESVANRIGRFLCLDKATATLARPSVARMCVELDLRKSPPSFIWVGLFEGFKQQILYEKLPKFCLQCYAHGHSTLECSRQRLDNHKSQPNQRAPDGLQRTPPVRQIVPAEQTAPLALRTISTKVSKHSEPLPSVSLAAQGEPGQAANHIPSSCPSAPLSTSEPFSRPLDTLIQLSDGSSLPVVGSTPTARPFAPAPQNSGIAPKSICTESSKPSAHSSGNASLGQGAFGKAEFISRQMDINITRSNAFPPSLSLCTSGVRSNATGPSSGAKQFNYLSLDNSAIPSSSAARKTILSSSPSSKDHAKEQPAYVDSVFSATIKSRSANKKSSGATNKKSAHPPASNRVKRQHKKKSVAFILPSKKPIYNIEANQVVWEAMQSQLASIEQDCILSNSVFPPKPPDPFFPKSKEDHNGEPINSPVRDIVRNVCAPEHNPQEVHAQSASDSDSSFAADSQPVSPISSFSKKHISSVSEGEEPPSQPCPFQGNRSDDNLSLPKSAKRNKRHPDQPLKIKLRARRQHFR